jgi:hypothetical protein
MKQKQKSQPYWMVGALGGAALLIAIRFRLPADLIWMIGFATLSGIGWLYYAPYLHAQKVFKSILMPQIVKCVDPHLKYNPMSNFSTRTLRASQLIPISYTGFNADDEFSGKIKHIQFGFRDLKLTVQKGSGKNKRTVEVFQGAVFDFCYPKNFSAHTVIHKDKIESMTGGYVAGLFQDLKQSVSHLKRVQLEHPDFEKQFQVLSTDQQEARYLITPKAMELMMAFTNEFGDNSHFSFYQNRFYVAIECPAVHFDMKHPEALDEVIARVEKIWVLIQRVAEVLDLDNQNYKVI